MIFHLSNRSQPVVWKPFSLTLFYDSGFEIFSTSCRSQPVVWKLFSLTLFYDSGFEIFSTSCLIPLDARLYLCFWSKLLIMYPGPSLWWGDIINQIFQKLQISDKAVCLEKNQSRKPSRKHNRWSQAPTSNILSNWCMLLQKKLFSLLSEQDTFALMGPCTVTI